MSQDEYQAFAARELGAASYRLLQTPFGLEALEKRKVPEREVSDVVLGVVFDALQRGESTDAELAEEFFKYLLPHAQSRSHGRVGPSLRRHLESQDLAQSVFGNLWQDIPDLEFTTFAQFLSMVIQRISWKASNRGRDLKRNKRSEDARVEIDIEDLATSAEQAGPQVEFAWAEDRELLIETIMSLPNERDRLLVIARLEGATIEEIATSFGLELESARRAFNRALERARAHIEESERRRRD
jgi:RNA polymerase sigma factor (sigma-70 family)